MEKYAKNMEHIITIWRDIIGNMVFKTAVYTQNQENTTISTILTGIIKNMVFKTAVGTQNQEKINISALLQLILFLSYMEMMVGKICMDIALW